MFNNLRVNQINAIEASIKNNFNSRIHAHSIGSDKSYIDINIFFNLLY